MSSVYGSCRLPKKVGALCMLWASLLMPSGPAAARPAGEVVVAMPQLSQLFDPTAMVGAVPYQDYDFVFDGLINQGPDGKYPALAESWEISADGKQIDFKLRRGVKFHNGDDFNAADVKFTFDRVMAPDSKHAYRRGFLDSIERIDVVNPHTARFVLKAPWLAFFTTFRYALTPIVPKAYYEKAGAKGFQENPIGTGPYMLAGMKAGEWTRYEANEQYWGVVPRIKTTTLRLVVEPFTRYAMLQRGEADIVSGLTGPLLEKIKMDPGVKVYSSRYSGTSGILFNKEIFPEAADRRVRLAIAHAINRKEIAEKMLGGVCQPATGMFTPGTYGFLEGLPQIPYHPAKAKALLAEAGIKSGHKITFTLQTQSFVALPNAPQVLEAVAGNLEAVGFTVERQNVDNAAWLKMMRNAKHPAVFYSPISSPDDGGEVMNSYFLATSGWTPRSIKVPKYDELFQSQLKASTPEERKKLIQQFAKLESENLENVPLLWCDTPFAVSTRRIKNWRPTLGSGYHMNIKQIELLN
jgi:peptide/nickel transport system substrate-binding protein